MTTHQQSEPEPPTTLGAKTAVEAIPPDISEALQRAGLDPSDPKVTKVLELTHFRGALPAPPPFILAEYEDVVPGLAGRIVGWTEEQRQHRLALERERASRAERRMDRSQLGALAVALGGLLMAGVVGIFGNAWVAGIIAIVAIGGPAAAQLLAGQGRSSPTGHRTSDDSRTPSPRR